MMEFPFQPGPASGSGELKARAEISAEYWQQLVDLLAQGEIDAGLARIIERDMFEPAVDGVPRTLSDRGWRAYQDGRRAAVEIAIASATRG